MAKTPTKKRRGPGRPRHSENRNTRQEIILASETLFSKMGYHATSLRRIAAGASVDLATVKYHFPDKTELYNEAILMGHHRLIDRFSALIPQIASAQTAEEFQKAIEAYAHALVHWAVDDESLVRMMLFRTLENIERPESASVDVQQILVRHISVAVNTAAEKGFARHIDVPALIAFLSQGIPCWILSATIFPRYLGPDDPTGELTLERMEAFITRMLVNSILPDTASNI